MMRRFLDGLLFGSGFAVALLAAWLAYARLVLPRMVADREGLPRTPAFDHPIDANVAAPAATQAAPPARDFDFFATSDERMKVPEGGGILAMAVTETPAGATRPSTYQLWLTEAALWQVRTSEDQAQLEALPRPADTGHAHLERRMWEQLGSSVSQSATTISAKEIAELRSSGRSARDGRLNGALRITPEGVVFLLPNPYPR